MWHSLAVLLCWKMLGYLFNLALVQKWFSKWWKWWWTTRFWDTQFSANLCSSFLSITTVNCHGYRCHIHLHFRLQWLMSPKGLQSEIRKVTNATPSRYGALPINTALTGWYVDSVNCALMRLIEGLEQRSNAWKLARSSKQNNLANRWTNHNQHGFLLST